MLSPLLVEGHILKQLLHWHWNHQTLEPSIPLILCFGLWTFLCLFLWLVPGLVPELMSAFEIARARVLLEPGSVLGPVPRLVLVGLALAEPVFAELRFGHRFQFD